MFQEDTELILKVSLFIHQELPRAPDMPSFYSSCGFFSLSVQPQFQLEAKNLSFKSSGEDAAEDATLVFLKKQILDSVSHVPGTVLNLSSPLTPSALMTN